MGPVFQDKAHVLLVGTGAHADYVGSLLATRSWSCSRCEDPVGVPQLLRNASDIDAVVLVPGDDLHAYTELTRYVKFDSRSALLSVVLVLTEESRLERSVGFAAGADDCIQLPAPPDEILLRLSNALRMKKASDSLEDATAVLTSLANAIEGRDAYTRGHVDRVSAYAIRIGQCLGLGGEDLSTLRIGGVVHDIGKIAVPDQILNKPGSLTDEEMAVVRLHPVVGHDVLQPVRTFRNVLPIVRWHHERPNGRGYPDGLSESELPLLPRIVSVADVFDAVSTPRAYRPAFSPDKYRAILAESAECGDLDPELVAILFQILDESAAAFATASTNEVS
jgi:putative two-component system response regulator